MSEARQGQVEWRRKKPIRTEYEQTRPLKGSSGGGGNRTRVRKASKTDHYTLSSSIVLTAAAPENRICVSQPGNFIRYLQTSATN